MTPSDWAKEKNGSLSIHVPVFCVEDPYGVLDKGDLTTLAKAEKWGRMLVTANNVFRSRAQLSPCDLAYKVISISVTSRHAAAGSNSFS
jgi:hypothetical protein